jgi:hypothetical protein
MDKVPRAGINPRTLVKNTIHRRSADASSLCYFIDSWSRFSPHCLQKIHDCLSGFPYHIIVPQVNGFKRLFGALTQREPWPIGPGIFK